MIKYLFVSLLLVLCPVATLAKCKNMYQRIGAEREIARQYYLQVHNERLEPATARNYCTHDDRCAQYMNRVCDYLD